MLRPDGLRHAQHDPADQRPPDRADPADDHRLEREQQPAGAGCWRRTTSTSRTPCPAMATVRERDGRRDPEDVTVVRPGELGRLPVVGHGPDQPARVVRDRKYLQPQQNARPPRRRSPARGRPRISCDESWNEPNASDADR